MKHNIIKTENYLLVVDDSEIKYDDHFIDEYKMLYMLKNESTEKHKSVKKVISHLPLNNSPVLERVPLLPPLEDEQSLQQPKMPVAFECEWNTKQMPEFHQDEPKTTSNTQGQTVLVGKYIY